MEIRVRYRDEDGREQEVDPRRLRGVALEEHEALAVPHAYRGRQGIVTRWWAATTGRDVVCGSEGVLHAAMLLDFDRDIVCFGASAAHVRVECEGRSGAAVGPVFFARTARGERLAVVHPPREGDVGRLEHEALRCAADVAGWRVVPLRVPGGGRLASLKVAAGFRHPQYADAHARAVLREVFARPGPLGRGVAAAGLPPGSMARGWHLLWTGDLDTDWERPLIPTSTVWTRVWEGS